MKALLWVGALSLSALGLGCSVERTFVEATSSGGGGPGSGGGDPTSTGTLGGGGGTQSETLTVTLPPGDVVLRQGDSVDVTVTIARTGGGTDPTVVTVTGLPSGVTADPLQVGAQASMGTLTLHATAGATQGIAPMTVTGAVGADMDDASASLVVAGAPGSPDATFVDATGTFQTKIGNVGTRGRGLAVQADGKIVVAGISAVSNGQMLAIRLDDAGALDASFGTAGITSIGIGGGSGGMTVAVDAAGKVWVGGFGNVDFDGNSALAVLSLDSAGVPDTAFGGAGYATFMPGTGYTTARAVLPMASGVATPGEWVNAVNATGGVDYGFDTMGVKNATYTSSNETLRSAILQPDGKILFGGGDPSGEMYIKRRTDVMNADATFGGGSGNGFVVFNGRQSIATGLAVLQGGQILVGGVSATDTNGTDSRVAFSRLATNGSVDISFGTAGLALTNVAMRTLSSNTMAVDSQGRIYFGGVIGNPNHQPVVARFNADGSVDATFGSGGVVVLSQFTADPAYGMGTWGIGVDAHDRVVVSGEFGPESSPSLFVARYWF